MHTLGQRLLRCIDDIGTTQAEVARQAGVSSASVSEWASDKVSPHKIKAEPLLRAAAYLNVSPLWLLLGKGQRAPDAPHIAAEPPPNYVAWPFGAIDVEQLRNLRPTELARIEGAWIITAQQLGFAVAKRRD